MLIYLLKSGLCLLVLFSFYKLCLENENFHKIKRYYLLAALILSFSLPLLTFTYEVEISTTSSIQGFEQLEYSKNEAGKQIINWEYLIYGGIAIYLSGFIFFGFRFFENLRSLLKEANGNERITELNYIYILLGKKLDPHSFFNYIFLNKKEFKDDKISEAVIEHEKAHVDQKHSLDLVFIEVLQVIFWFNPILFWIKRSIKLNHEFLADKEVLSKDFNALEYSNILFNYSSGYHHNSLSSPINHSLIKKRIIMITKDFSIKKLLMRAGLFVPVLGCCIFFFNNEIVAKPVYLNDKTEETVNSIELPQAEENSIPISNISAYSEPVLQQPNLKIRIEGEKVWINGKSVKIKNFAKEVDAFTEDLSEEELKELSIHMKTNNSSKAFMENLNREFEKTRLSKITGRSILPPPPPMPQAPKVSGHNPPTPPPPPGAAHHMKMIHKHDSAKVAIQIERMEMREEMKHERDRMLAERELMRVEREKVRELERKFRAERVLSKEEREQVRKDIERKQTELREKMRDVERKHLEMERKQMKMKRMHQDIPAPPPPPLPENAIDNIEKEGGSFFYNGEKISAAKAKEIIEKKNNINIHIKNNAGAPGKVEIRDN